eukprot:434097_1
MLAGLFGGEKKEEQYESSIYPIHMPIDPLNASRSQATQNIFNECSHILVHTPLLTNNMITKMFDKREFNEEYKLKKLINCKSNCEIWTVLRKDNNNEHICKIYNIGDENYKSHCIQHYDSNSIYHYNREYKIIRSLNVLLYHNIYYDKLNQKCLIVMESLQFDLHSLYTNDKYKRYKPKNEFDIAKIAYDILDQLWVLQESCIILRNLSPSNIMYRNYSNEYNKIYNNEISNGYKIIGFNKMIKFWCYDTWDGEIGYTAPENVANEKNKYVLRHDIWSFGLI